MSEDKEKNSSSSELSKRSWSDANLAEDCLEDLKKKASSKKMGKWSIEEDELLRELIKTYGEKCWRIISTKMNGRSPIQCLHRWTKILKPGLIKGPWSEEEDERLIEWVSKEGPKKWSRCSSFVPGRNGKQCRERWINSLNPEIKKAEWSPEEDQMLFDLYQKYGTCWSKMTQLIPGRTENSIKNRFYSAVRKINTEENLKPQPEHHTRKMQPAPQQYFLKYEDPYLAFNPIYPSAELIPFYNYPHRDVPFGIPHSKEVKYEGELMKFEPIVESPDGLSYSEYIKEVNSGISRNLGLYLQHERNVNSQMTYLLHEMSNYKNFH